MDKSVRLNWVDAAKGISILLVVMMYAAYGAGEATQGVGALHYIIGFATPFRMPEFFLISGLFLANVINRPWGKFADRRAVHYLYFYLLWAVIHIGLKVGLASGDPVMAAQSIAFAAIQPYGVLWFIYVLALTSIAAKVLMELRLPHWLVFAGAAALNMAEINTSSYAVDQFARYFVFFYSGYAFAPAIFKIVEKAMSAPRLATAGLVAWALVNAYFVFTPGALTETGLAFTPSFVAEPGHFTMGLAEAASVQFVLALVGTVALCVGAGLLSQINFMGWLSYIGKHSLVIYVAFVLPLGFSRIALVKLDLLTDTTALSVVTMVIAIILPLMAHWLVEKIGFGKFLFNRPSWFALPAKPSKSDHSIKFGAPAE